MSDRPEDNNRAGGWFAPPNADSGTTNQPATEPAIPLPGATPDQPGAWYAPNAEPSTTPAVAAPTPAPAVPQGAALSTELDYDNYVPGVGFVPKGQKPPTATASAQTPTQPIEDPLPTEPPQPTQELSPSLADIPLPPQPAPMVSQSAQPAQTLQSADTPELGDAAPLPDIPGVDRSETPIVPAPAQPAPVKAQPVQQAKQTPTQASAPIVIPAPTEPEAAPATDAAPAPLTSDREHAIEEEAIKQPADQPKAAAIRTTSEMLIPTPEELAATPLAQRYIDVEQSVQALRRRYSVGRLNRDQLQAELRKLMILDDEGHWWMIGLETDRWYKYNGRDWLPADPPGRVATGSGSIAGRTASSGTSLAKPLIGPKTTPVRDYGIPAEDDSPLPQRVSIDDAGATVVGRAAPRLDNLDFASGATVPTGATVVSGTASADTVNVVPSALARGDQPDYGPRPTGFAVDRHRMVTLIVVGSLVVTFLALAASIVAIMGAVLYYSSVVNQYSAAIDNLPTKVKNQSQSVTMVDAAGNPLSQRNDPNLGKRIYVPLDQISDNMIGATVATEDQRFFTNPGFDVIAIARAIIGNATGNAATSGASTITQELTRQMVLESGAAADRSSARKVREIIVASEVARRYTKSQVLEYYLNTVYYGNLAYGAEAAAQTYFKKPAKQLDLSEAAYLAGLVQAPATYDPAVNPIPSFNRLDEVMTLIGNLGCIQIESDGNTFCGDQKKIDSENINKANVKAVIAPFKPQGDTSKYPHFANYVWEWLENKFGKEAVYTSGYKVYTTLDPKIQDIAQAAVKSQIDNLKRLNVNDGAVLAMRPDGEIVAMVGSYDFNNSDPKVAGQVNATRSWLQPGSSIKPFVYYAALDRDPNKADPNNNYWTPATVIWDVPSTFNNNGVPYPVTDYDNQYRGPETLRYALANSLNVPAVKTLAFVGVDRFKQVATKMGLTFQQGQPETAGLTSALGSVNITMLDMVRGYSVFDNAGMLVDPYAVTKVTHIDQQNNLVVDFDITTSDKPTPVKVADPAITYLVTNILSDNQARSIEFGPNSPLRLPGDRPAAAKTGTTNDFKDNWTLGYTPQLIVGVWVGNANGEAMATGVNGITGAAPIWNAVMSQALQDQPALQFPVPPNINQAQICSDWGTVAFQGCAHTRSEIFYAPNPIRQPGEILQRIDIDTYTGGKVTASCQDFKQSELFLNIDDPTAFNWLNTSPGGQAFLQSYGLTSAAAPPKQDCDPNIPRPNVVLTKPTPNETVPRGPYPVYGTVIMTNMASYEIDVAPGANPPDTAFKVQSQSVTQPPAPGSYLGNWDSSSLTAGVYTVRLHALDKSNRFVNVNVVVNVSDQNQNVIPTAASSTDANGTPIPIFNAPTNAPIPSMTPIVVNPGGPTPTSVPVGGPTATKPLFAATFTPAP